MLGRLVGWSDSWLWSMGIIYGLAAGWMNSSFRFWVFSWLGWSVGWLSWLVGLVGWVGWLGWLVGLVGWLDWLGWLVE